MTRPTIKRLILTRTPCFGKCPAYRLEISADGTVQYRGDVFVLREGDHNWAISADRMEALAALIDESEFFTYVLPVGVHVTCVSKMTLDIRLSDGRHRRLMFIEDDEPLDNLSRRIDELAGAHDYAYRSLNRYRMIAEGVGVAFERHVIARSADHAREVLVEDPWPDASAAERGLDGSAWTGEDLGPSEYSFPGNEGFVEG